MLVVRPTYSQILDQQLPICEQDPAWADWRDAPRSDPYLGNQTELLRQNRVRRDAVLGPETLALFEVACSGPMEAWVESLCVLNISCDLDG